MFFHKTLELNETLEIIGSGRLSLEYWSINLNSVRLQAFKEHGCTCINCGVTGTEFRVQSSSKNDKNPHIGLWTNDGIQMTKDHIIPKSFGGYDSINNMQVMCSVCNCKKGNSFTEDDFNNGSGAMNYTQAITLNKLIQEEKLENENSDIIDKVINQFDEYYLHYGKLTDWRKDSKYDPFAQNLSIELELSKSYLLNCIKKLAKETSGYFKHKGKRFSIIPNRILDEIKTESKLYAMFDGRNFLDKSIIGYFKNSDKSVSIHGDSLKSMKIIEYVDGNHLTHRNFNSESELFKKALNILTR